MSVIVGLIVVFFGGGYLVRSVSQARSGAWAGPRSAGMRQRAGNRAAAAGQRPVRHEARLLRLDAQLKDWLAERDHGRKNGGGGGSLPSAASRPPRAAGAGRSAVATMKRLGSFRPASAAAGGNGSNGSGTTPAPASASPPPGLNGAAPRSPSPSANGSRGRTSTVASTGTGGVEQLVEGINQVHAAAVTGGIHAKQQGMKASTEGSIRFSQMASMLSRTMSEPGSNYGPEICEPLAKASQHLQAAAMAFGEADTALTTLMSMSVGDLAQSARQAPHHAELSESGSH